jgi:hypothetical protein
VGSEPAFEYLGAVGGENAKGASERAGRRSSRGGRRENDDPRTTQLFDLMLSNTSQCRDLLRLFFSQLLMPTRAQEMNMW